MLSVLIVAFSVSVELAHGHGPTESRGPASPQSRCSIYAVSHSPALPAHAVSAITPVQTQATTIVAAPQLSNRLEVEASFIRPPPVL